MFTQNREAVYVIFTPEREAMLVMCTQFCTQITVNKERYKYKEIKKYKEKNNIKSYIHLLTQIKFVFS